MYPSQSVFRPQKSLENSNFREEITEVLVNIDQRFVCKAYFFQQNIISIFTQHFAHFDAM